MADITRNTTASPIRGTTAQVSPGEHHDERPSGGPLADAKELGTDLVAAVRDSATSLFEEQRNRAADEIAALGQALQRSAQSLDQGGGTVARYADDAARHIGDFATTVRNRSWDELTGDVEAFARRWPLAFMAAAVGVGFAAGRFLMASARPADPAMGVGDAGLPSSTNPATRPPVATGSSVGGAASATARASYGAPSSRENG